MSGLKFWKSVIKDGFRVKGVLESQKFLNPFEGAKSLKMKGGLEN